jgi:hypothetical protein
VRLLPWYLREVAAPGAAAALLTLIRIEGRPAHLAVVAMFRYALGPRELVGLRPYTSSNRRFRPHEMVFLADGSDPLLRRVRYIGPGVVRVRAAHSRSTRNLGPLGWRARRPSVTLAPLPGKRPPARRQAIALAAGACLEVRS